MEPGVWSGDAPPVAALSSSSSSDSSSESSASSDGGDCDNEVELFPEDTSLFAIQPSLHYDVDRLAACSQGR